MAVRAASRFLFIAIIFAESGQSISQKQTSNPFATIPCTLTSTFSEGTASYGCYGISSTTSATGWLTATHCVPTVSSSTGSITRVCVATSYSTSISRSTQALSSLSGVPSKSLTIPISTPTTTILSLRSSMPPRSVSMNTSTDSASSSRYVFFPSREAHMFMPPVFPLPPRKSVVSASSSKSSYILSPASHEPTATSTISSQAMEVTTLSTLSFQSSSTLVTTRPASLNSIAIFSCTAE